jgi:starch phosphorylase
MVLRIGGVRLLEALQTVGLEVAPEVCHLNEGHSAFAAVERAAGHMRRTGETDFFRAHRALADTLAFTTHTPVAAGHDAFPAELIEAYLAEYRQHLGLTHDQFMSLGRDHRGGHDDEFSMTVLALRRAHGRGAVSQLHREVSRELWSGIGTGIHNARPRIEMAALTNGVHTGTWAGPEMSAAYDRCLNWPWRTAPHRASSWARLMDMDPQGLWAARSAQRARLLEHLVRAGCSVPERPLVIGFARLFATYKRAGLLLEQPERLAGLLGNPERPVLVCSRARRTRWTSPATPGAAGRGILARRAVRWRHRLPGRLRRGVGAPVGARQ